LRLFKDRPGVFHILVAIFFFSLMQICVKKVAHLPTQEAVLFRALFSVIACSIIIWRRKLKFFGNNKKDLLGRGISGASALFLFFYGLQVLPLATAVTLQFLSPIFTVLFAAWMMKEPATKKQWLLFLIAFVGVYIINGADPDASKLGIGASILAAIFAGLAYNFVRRLKDTDEPIVVVMYFPLLVLPIFGPYALLTWQMPQGWDWVYLLLIGLFTQIAQIHMTKAYQLEKAADITIFNYLGILLAAVYGYAFFGETVSCIAGLGMLIIVTSVYIAVSTSGKSKT
jgi:drug/metabolite transporter (DMT)-like permease